MRIKIINGPNLNLLGQREPEVYGSESFDAILSKLEEHYPDVDMEYFQSNIEGELIDALQNTNQFDGVILNPAAYTHTSVAIGDAIRSISVPVVEVHLSNTFDREDFRHKSYTAGACKGVIIGMGWRGYLLALEFLKLSK